MCAMKALSLRSPAKLNLFLKVLNKRNDGFHNIVTLFERINLFDEIRLSSNLSGKIRITCNHPHVPTGPKNLVYKIAVLLKKDFGILNGVDIAINKRIPVAAGLAGGSSNAATALLGLNKIWKLKLSQDQLLFYARKVGSDVVFFLYDTSWALGTERGDRIKKIKIDKKFWHILAVPRLKMYSWKVYGALKMKLTKKRDDVTILIHHLRKIGSRNVGPLMLNDLEPAVIQLSPNLLKLKEKLNSLDTQGVMISGSGPAVFGIAQSESAAKAAALILKKRFSQVFVVRTL